MIHIDTTKQKKIAFVVEDDPFLVKAYQIKLAQEGMDVLVVMDGNEAIRKIVEHEPADVVLLDLMLPGASGFDVLQAIRGDSRWKDVPVIVLSNLGQSQDVERAKQLGAQDYIVKANTRISDMLDQVKKYLT